MDIETLGTPEAAPADATLRRRLLGAGLIGLAGSLVPSLASRAGATAAATTTTQPPKRPNGADTEALLFAQEVELAAVALYDIALAGTALNEDVRPTFEALRASHLAYGQSMSGLLGKPAPTTPLASVVSANKSAFGGSDLAALASAAVTLENTAVSTHLEILGALQGTDGANLVASIITTESRHATVLADIAGKQSDLDALLVNDVAPLAKG